VRAGAEVPVIMVSDGGVCLCETDKTSPLHHNFHSFGSFEPLFWPALAASLKQ